MNKIERLILLQKLEKHLKYYKYDQLGISTLIKMRNEVYGEIQKIIEDDKK